MKRLIFTLLASFACLLSASFPLSALANPDPATEDDTAIEYDEAKVKKVVAQHQKNLSLLQEHVAHIDDPEFYKEWAAIDVRTRKVVKFTELTDRRKDVLYIVQAERVEQVALQESKQLEELFHFVSNIEDEETQKQFEEGIKSLEQVQKELQSTRVKLAGKRIQLVDAALENYKDNETLVEELKRYKALVVKYNVDKKLTHQEEE